MEHSRTVDSLLNICCALIVGGILLFGAGCLIILACIGIGGIV